MSDYTIVLSQPDTHEFRVMAEGGDALAWMWPQYHDNESYVDMSFDVCVALPPNGDGRVSVLVHFTGGDPVLRAEIRYGKFVITGIDKKYVVIESEDVL